MGVIFGSFTSAANYRLHTADKSFFTGRSFCIFCKTILKLKDLIPLFSYLSTGGHCRYCKKRYGIQYLLNEILLGLIFATTYVVLNPVPIHELIISYILILIAYMIASYDAMHQEIPDLYSFAFIGISLILGLSHQVGIFNQLLGVLIGAGFFGFQFLISKGRWIGSGDILLGIGMGLALGIKLTIVALIISYLLGSIVGIFLLLKNKSEQKPTIAFAPFLMLGTVITLFWGETIYRLYIDLTFLF